MNFLKKIIISPFYFIFWIGFVYFKFLKFLNITFYTKWYDLCLRYIDKEKIKIFHTSTKKIKHEMKFYTPNSRSKNRIMTFSKKEPDTLEWIDSQKDNGYFFDIGANIGIYSIYNSIVNSGKTYCFEPSGFNTLQLMKNINLNNLQENIIVITNPLAAEDNISSLFLNKLDTGASEVFFGRKVYSEVKKKNDKKEDGFFVNCFGISIDTLLEKKIIPIPNYIKIDVDGSEEDILKGAKRTLIHNDCRSILIEVNNLISSLETENFLNECGFKFSSKNSKNKNQIWEK